MGVAQSEPSWHSSTPTTGSSSSKAKKVRHKSGGFSVTREPFNVMRVLDSGIESFGRLKGKPVSTSATPVPASAHATRNRSDPPKAGPSECSRAPELKQPNKLLLWAKQGRRDSSYRGPPNGDPGTVSTVDAKFVPVEAKRSQAGRRNPFTPTPPSVAYKGHRCGCKNISALKATL